MAKEKFIDTRKRTAYVSKPEYKNESHLLQRVGACDIDYAKYDAIGDLDNDSQVYDFLQKDHGQTDYFVAHGSMIIRKKFNY